MEVFDLPSGDSGVNDDDNAGGVQACGWLGWLCQGFASRHRDWLFWAGMTEGGLYMVLWGEGGEEGLQRWARECPHIRLGALLNIA